MPRLDLTKRGIILLNTLAVQNCFVLYIQALHQAPIQSSLLAYVVQTAQFFFGLETFFQYYAGLR